MIFRVYFKNGKLKEYWKDHILYAATMLASAGISYGLCEVLLAGTGVMVLIGRLLICSAVSVLVFWLMWRKSKRYDAAKGWMKRFIRA